MNANAIRLRSGTLDSLRGLTLFSMIAYPPLLGSGVSPGPAVGLV